MPRGRDIPGPYQFYFYSFDCYEPQHVHVRRERMVCEFWLEPVSVARNYGFSSRELNVIRSYIDGHPAGFWRHGMSTAANSDARIKRVEVTDEAITAHLIDGRVISVPLAWSWRLAGASPAQRARYEIIGDGQGVHWPDIDEDISAEGMLAGTPASPPKQKREQA